MSDLSTALRGHEFRSFSTTRNGVVTHGAHCECGYPLSWTDRYDRHADHVLTVIRHEAWEEGKEAVARAFLKPAVNGVRATEPNPYPIYSPES